MKQALFAFFLLFSIGAFSQTMADLFTQNTVPFYFFGNDYTHVKLIGPFNQYAEAGQTGAQLVRDKYFEAWNYFYVTEPEKYDVGLTFHKIHIKVDIEPLLQLNKTASPEEMEASSETNYTAAQLAEYVSKYDFGVKSGIGIVLLAESLNKLTEQGVYHVIFINLADNSVIYSERLSGAVGGFGLRNYYAKSFYNVLELIRGKKYREWKKVFAP